ncbi:fasciclin domain-containing protein [Niabella aquatica]
MMNILSRVYISCLFFLCLGCWSCSNKWDDHIGIADPQSQKTLYEVIGENAEFSTFFALVDRSGYAEELKSSKNYTLIVPTNDAVESVKAQYDFNDTSVVRSFVGYHIINSVYNVNEAMDTVRAKNLRNKYVEFTHGAFDGVPAQRKNIVAGNGLYHVVSTPLKPLLNIYTLVHTMFPGTLQADAVRMYDTTLFPNWISEVRRPMTTENSKYTYFVVDDNYFTGEYNKLAYYYRTHYDNSIPDSTTRYYTLKALLKDLTVAGDVSLGTASTELLSIAGTKFSVSDADIISKHKTSNGSVYRVKKLDYKLTDRIKEIRVLGTQPSGYRQNDKRGNIYFRNKRDLLDSLYNDIEIYGHGVTSFYVKYRVANVNVVKYKVYGRAIMGLAGDPQTATFTQYVQFFNPSSVSVNELDQYNRPVTDSAGANAVRMPFVVQPLNHKEVYLGEVTQDEFGYLRLLVVSNGTGPVILEYLRFVPQIQ